MKNWSRANVHRRFCRPSNERHARAGQSNRWRARVPVVTDDDVIGGSAPHSIKLRDETPQVVHVSMMDEHESRSNGIK